MATPCIDPAREHAPEGGVACDVDEWREDALEREHYLNSGGLRGLDQGHAERELQGERRQQYDHLHPQQRAVRHDQVTGLHEVRLNASRSRRDGDMLFDEWSGGHG